MIDSYEAFLELLEYKIIQTNDPEFTLAAFFKDSIRRLKNREKDLTLYEQTLIDDINKAKVKSIKLGPLINDKQSYIITIPF